jgi:hypothetical protein
MENKRICDRCPENRVIRRPDKAMCWKCERGVKCLGCNNRFSRGLNLYCNLCVLTKSDATEVVYCKDCNIEWVTPKSNFIFNYKCSGCNKICTPKYEL